MKTYTSNNIRNIAVVGHGGKGKTTLCEAMLYVAGATDRLGKVAEGNTVLDFDAEERRRKSSVSSAMAAIEWDNTKLNIIDAPGLFDFEGGVAEAVRAAEAVLIVTSAGSGVDVGTEKAFNAAEKKGIAKFFAITKTDSDHRNFYKTFEALKEVYGNKLCPTIIPYMEGNITKCYVNLMTGMAFEYDADGNAKKVDVPNDPVIEEMTSAFMEAVATTDEALMDKFCPGPITVILRKKKEIPSIVTGGKNTVGIRIPDNPVALAVLSKARIPLAVPSANMSSHPSPKSAMDVYNDMQGRIPLILDGGVCSIGTESTIVDCTDEFPVIIRQGAISEKEINEILRRI